MPRSSLTRIMVLTRTRTQAAGLKVRCRYHYTTAAHILTYETETWSMMKANLQSLERKEKMMVRWMCGVSLSDSKRSVDLYSLPGVQNVADGVRHDRFRWLGHLERIGVWNPCG